jgi:hypothetical protein
MAKAYRWSKWFQEAEGFQVVRGRDFDCTMTAMTQQVRNNAIKHGVKVSIKEEGDTLYVKIRRPNASSTPPSPKKLSRSSRDSSS